MLIIDINKEKVYNQPRFDLDVVVLKGASPALVNKLTELTTKAATKTPQPVKPSNSRKVALTGRKITAKTVSACCGAGPASKATGVKDDFALVFAQIGKALNEARSAQQQQARVTSSFETFKADRATLQEKEAQYLTNTIDYVEALRLAVQGSSVLNLHANTITTRNVIAGIALYSFYSDDTGFTSTEGAAKIASIIQVSPDTISRLGTDMRILNRSGRSTATRYFVNSSFGKLLIKTLQSPKFSELRGHVDSIQNEIDQLGSL